MILLCLLFWLILYILFRVILGLAKCKFGYFFYDGISVLGFGYDVDKDIFYSRRNAWQKNFGYTHLYDVLSPVFRMILDTEPIKFYYNDKNWLITFWKGQYGIVTGAEIGVYWTDQKKINKNTVYFPAGDDEMLDMHFVLYKNGKMLARADAKHWWLAVFKLGMFSRPKELMMDINIDFPNNEMLAAFLTSFKKLGYEFDDFVVINNTFCFRYKRPLSKKVWTRSWLSDGIKQFLNFKNTLLYKKYLIDFTKKSLNDDFKNEVNKS